MAVVLGTKLLFSAAVPGISVKLAKLLSGEDCHL